MNDNEKLDNEKKNNIIITLTQQKEYKPDSAIIISSSTIKRLASDVRKIIKEPLIEQGIYYKHDDTNMLLGYAMIVGPKNTPYENGYYFFDFSFPINYPFSPPIVKYHTNDGYTRFNPNLYKSGKVCVSILNTWHGEQWTGCQTISSILLTLCTLFTENPLLNEPGVLSTSYDIIPYNKSIEYKNYEIAIYNNMVNINNSKIFNIFYNDMKLLFLKNYDSIITNIKNKISCDDNKEYIVKLYHMITRSNYSPLLIKIENLKNSIE